MATKTTQKERAVVLGIEHPGGRRSVLFGYTKDDLDGESITLRDARNAVKWSTDTHGVFGLVSGGPKRGSRITAKVPTFTLMNLRKEGGPRVGFAAEATAAAVIEWEKGLWS